MRSIVTNVFGVPLLLELVFVFILFVAFVYYFLDVAKLAEPMILIDFGLVAAGKAYDSKVVLADVVPVAAILIVTCEWVSLMFHPSTLGFNYHDTVVRRLFT